MRPLFALTIALLVCGAAGLRPAAARVATAPAAAGAVDLPATPVGEHLAWVLARINGDATSLTEQEIMVRFASGFLASFPAPVLLDLLRQTSRDYAPITFAGFAYPPIATGAVALIVTGTGMQGALVLTIEAAPPHRITRLEMNEPPAPTAATGRRVDIGDRSLFLDCLGSGGPTVVLEGGIVSDWAAVQPAAAAFTRVCAYDRPDSPGSHSDPTAIRTAQEVVDDLHALLIASGEPRPYVLVGHSLGGIYVQLYAYQHPGEVAGLVLVDPTPEDFAARLAILQTAVYGTPAPDPSLSAGSPPPSAEEISYGQLHAAREAGSLRPMPLIVISHGKRPDPSERPSGWPIAEEERILRELHAEIARLVPDGRHVVAEASGHDIHNERPDLVIEAIRQVVEAVRDPAAWTTPAGTPVAGT